MTEKKLLEKIAQILIREWDPIGVCNVPQAQDEYDSYAGPIAKMLASGVSVTDLSQYLIDIETKAMGLAGNRQRAHMVAQRLRAVVAA